MMKQQRGLSFPGFILGAGLLVLGSILGLKLIPAYMQSAEISRLFAAIADDPDLQKGSIREIRTAFGKRALVDNITVIKAEDLEVEAGDGKPLIRASYTVKVPLVGNATLLLDFHPSSAH